MQSESCTGKAMGLLDKIVGKVADSAAKAYLKTDKNYRFLVDNGYYDEDELTEDIMSSVKAQREAEQRAKQAEAARHHQWMVQNHCCTTCKHHFWGECWYAYNTYGGNTQPVEYPDTTTCDCYERDWNK